VTPTLPEFVGDALSLRGDRVDLAAAHLVEDVGLDPTVALRLALGILVQQQREVATLAEDLEDLRADHERLFGKTKLWLVAHPEIDPEIAAELELILEDNF
jgi:hypothetical protein